MKLEENLKAVKYIRDEIDLTVTEEGFVILPAWQFALFVKEYEERRTNGLLWFGMFVLIVAWFLIDIIMLR